MIPRWTVSNSTRAAVAGALMAFAVLALDGCTNAQLVNVWQDPSFGPRPLHSVLVVSQRADAAQRRLWEDAMRAQMSKDGVSVVASYELFPDAPPTRNDVARAMQDRALDGALILKPLAVTKETRRVPGWTSVEPRDYYNPWTDTRTIVYRTRRHPGYWQVDRVSREQVTVWSAGDDARMVWAGTVEVENPYSPDDLRADVARGVVPQMKKAGLI